LRKRNQISILLILALLCASNVMQAQTSNSSPYSRFGLGKLNPNSNTLIMALGGSCNALRNPISVNPYNPASYTAFDTTSFVFDAALRAKIMTLKTNTSSYKVNDAGLAYITMGFPVAKWWKSSLGIVPYSTVDYMIGNDSIVENLGKVKFGYTGSGGLNRAYIGNGFKLSEHLSVGANLSYYFGTINRDRTISFPDSNYYFSSKITNSTQIRNLIVDFGLQYYTPLKNGLTLTTGLTFSPAQKMSGTANNLAVNYYHDYITNRDITGDTVMFEPGLMGDVLLPMNIGAGVSIGNTNRWAAFADFQWQQWSKYTYYGQSQSLNDSYRISIGGQLKPSPLDVGKYWKRINYRAGMRFEQSNLKLRDTQLNEFGFSFGAGLPMKKTKSTLNLAFEVGSYGSTNNNLIKENFFRFTIGASLFEKWFLKRKFD
jgi:long-subunit fatty acid transport protein